MLLESPPEFGWRKLQSMGWASHRSSTAESSKNLDAEKGNNISPRMTLSSSGRGSLHFSSRFRVVGGMALRFQLSSKDGCSESDPVPVLSSWQDPAI